MLSVSYAGKNACSAGKTSGVLRGGASGANRCYVLAHCGGGGQGKVLKSRPETVLVERTERYDDSLEDNTACKDDLVMTLESSDTRELPDDNKKDNNKQ